VTLGNHTYRRDGIGPYLERSERVIRPANMGRWTPGRGVAYVDGVAVISLMGHLFVDVAVSPWEMVDALVEAMAQWLDGKVTAVIGTHTHIQTNDARVQRKGTAAITDAGMCGPHDSVIGVKSELAIRRMRTKLPVRFEPAEGGVRLEGVVVECSDDGRALGIELLRVPV
jgi:calcineurin-like phosphoesterase